jgi:hypothetical protein
MEIMWRGLERNLDGEEAADDGCQVWSVEL